MKEKAKQADACVLFCPASSCFVQDWEGEVEVGVEMVGREEIALDLSVRLERKGTR